MLTENRYPRQEVSTLFYRFCGLDNGVNFPPDDQENRFPEELSAGQAKSGLFVLGLTSERGEHI
jgi:hypothetical protein